MSQQWEYCLLSQGWSRVGSYFNVEFGSTGNTALRHDLKGNQGNFVSAMAALGRAGWELVTATSSAGTDWGNTSAYFKRPIQPGRLVDDVLF
jgi:hypothetical protein